MLSDTYNAGSSWVPLKAKEDSYAVITGYASYLTATALQHLFSRHPSHITTLLLRPVLYLNRFPLVGQKESAVEL